MSCKAQTIILVVSFLTLLSGCLMPSVDFDPRQDIFPGASGDTWCSTDYAKRIDINVNNTGGSALTNYQVYVDLSSNPINESSMRVYNVTSCALRPHWCENVTSGNCIKLWINYSAVAGSSWTNNTAIYFDNVTASSVSDGSATFYEFLNKSSTSGWTTASLTVSTSGNFLRFYNAAGGSAGDARRFDWSTPSFFQMQLQMKNLNLDATWDNIMIMTLDGSLSHRLSWTCSPRTSFQTNIYCYDAAYVEIGTNEWTEGTEHIVKYVINESNSASGIDYYLYDTSRSLLASETGRASGLGSPTDCDGIFIGDGASSGEVCDVYVRWLFIAKTANVEPVTSLGSEESQPGVVVISNKQPTSPISKSLQAANFAISATISEATNNNWEINRTGSYEHLEWDNSTTAPAYTFSPQTEGVGIYKVKLTAYNATVPTNNASTTWSTTVSNITISSSSPGLTDTKYTSNRTVTYLATPSRIANCSWRYQNGTLIEWDNSTIVPSMELWINSSTVTAFNVTLTAYDSECPADYNSTSWGNSIVDNIFDSVNYTWVRWDTYNGIFYTGVGGQISFGDVDNDGSDEMLIIDSSVFDVAASKSIIIYEMDGTSKIYNNVTTASPAYISSSVHDVDQDGTNELLCLLSHPNDARADLFLFNTTHLNRSNTNKDIMLSGSNNPKAISWINISNQEHFYTVGCGSGETSNVFLNLTSFSITELDDFSASGEDNVAWDIDNDGDLELLVVEGYAANAAKVWLYELNYTTGAYITKTMLFDNDLKSAQHYTANILVGDVDNDGIDNLIILWTPTSDPDLRISEVEAYEFDGIIHFGEGNYSEGFAIDTCDSYELGVTAGHNRYFVADVDGDGLNEFVAGTYSYTNPLDLNVWTYDISSGGSSIVRKSIAYFPTTYMAPPNAATYSYQSITPAFFDGDCYLSVGSENSTAEYRTEIFKMETKEATAPAISNVQNGSISSTSQYINWTVNQTTHNRVVYDKGSLAPDSIACEGQWSATHVCVNASDGNWSTYAESAGAMLAYAYFNHTVPTGANQPESLWHVKDEVGHANLTIPSACWGATLYLRAMGSDIGNSITWQCDNGPGWTTLRSSVANIAYEEEIKFKYISSWDNSTAAPNITLSGLAASTQYEYQVWSYNVTNTSLSANSDIMGFTTATDANQITIAGGDRTLLCNWSADTTFTNIATNLTNSTDFFYYNSTAQLWTFYNVNRSINADTVIPEHASVFIHFNATTIVDCNVLTAETITIPTNVWYYTTLRESAAKTLTEINASITSDGCVIANLYAWDSPAGAYTNTGSYSVLPNEGVAIYATTGCSWDGGV